MTCEIYCDYGWATDPNTGCEVCACNDPCQVCIRYKYHTYQIINEGCNSCASLAELVLCFIACFILLVIGPFSRSELVVKTGPGGENAVKA